MISLIETNPLFRTRAELEQLQVSKLQSMLVEIYDKNKFYTDKFDQAGFDPASFASIRDLSGIPFTKKSELVADQASNGFAANLTYPLSSYVRFHQTFGTTGDLYMCSILMIAGTGGVAAGDGYLRKPN